MALKSPILNSFRCGTIKTVKSHLPSKRFFATNNIVKGLVIGVYKTEDGRAPKLTPGGKKYDAITGKKLSALVKEMGITGALGKGNLIKHIDEEFDTVAVMGVGRENNTIDAIDECMDNVRIATGIGARSCQVEGCNHIFVDTMEYPEQAAEGVGLAVNCCHEKKRANNQVKAVKIFPYDSSEMNDWSCGLFRAEFQNLARRMSVCSQNLITPSAFTKVAVDVLSPFGIKVKIRNLELIEQNFLISLFGATKVSCEPPVILELSYYGASHEENPILLINDGKSLNTRGLFLQPDMNFNSGNLRLRPSKDMEEYRVAITRAAMVVAAIGAAAKISMPLNIFGVISLCRNISNDVFTLFNGRTVAVRDNSEVGNDALTGPILYAAGIYEPAATIDVAAIRKRTIRNFGSPSSEFLNTSSILQKEFHIIDPNTGGGLWRSALWKYFKRLASK